MKDGLFPGCSSRVDSFHLAIPPLPVHGKRPRSRRSVEGFAVEGIVVAREIDVRSIFAFANNQRVQEPIGNKTHFHLERV